MTQVEFLNAIVNSNITDEVITYATERLAKHDIDLAKAKAKRAEKAKTTDANVEVALGFLTETPQTCSDLVALFVANGMARADEKPITPQYVAKLMKPLVDGGKAVRLDVKTAGADGKSKSAKAYTVATPEVE